MKLYGVDVQIAGTAYIKAATEDEARAKLAELSGGLEVENAGECDVEICGLPYTDPDLPDVSLSPAMTVHGVWPGDDLRLHEEELQEDEND